MPPLFLKKCLCPLPLKISEGQYFVAFNFGILVLLEGKGMGCAYVTQLRLTNSRFCILCVRMNHFEVHRMVSSREVDSKVLGMAILLKYFYEKKAKWGM